MRENNESNMLALHLLNSVLKAGFKVVGLDETNERLSTHEQEQGYIDILLTIERNDPTRRVDLNYFEGPDATGSLAIDRSHSEADGSLVDFPMPSVGGFQGFEAIVNSAIHWLNNQTLHDDLL